MSTIYLTQLRPRIMRALAVCATLLVVACDQEADEAASAVQDSPPPRTINVRGNPVLVENSVAVTTVSQPSIVFGVNDSGNDPILFAIDTLGADRGSWQVTPAQNVDWEAAASGPCGAMPSTATSGIIPGRCLYIGDVGDNGAQRPYLTIYRVPEPAAMSAGARGQLRPERMDVRYPTGRHDVEAMYVTGAGDLFLITKRPLAESAGRARPALVFRLPATAWGTNGAVMTDLVDSLPIIPEAQSGRQVTDAALAPDGARLAVRTYREVFIIAVDPATGRLTPGARWWSCPVTVEEQQGEGIGWLGGELVLTSEGRNAPLLVMSCPEPPAG